MKTTSSLLLACTLLACGGDGGGGSVDSGLPAEKKGSELSDSEGTTLCEAQFTHLGTLVSEQDAHRFACVGTGITAALLGDGSVMSCQIVYDMCIKTEPEPSEPGTCTLTFLDTCDATVAEIEACLTARNELLADSFKSASCEDVKNTAPSEPESPAACSSIESTCPGIG